MNEQLDSLKKEIKQYEEKTKGVIRIGLHIMTSYSDKTPNNQLYLEFLNSIPLTFERLQKDLSKRFSSLKPNLMICWKIPKKIVFNDSEQTFPGVGGKIKDFGNRSAYSSFGDGGFKRFDGGIRVGCGLAWEMLYAELGYDFGLTNIGDDYFNDTHNGAFFANIGINF